MAWTQEARDKARATTLARNAEKKRVASLNGGSSVTATVPSIGGASGTVAVGGDDGLTVSVKTDPKPERKPTLRERLGLGSTSRIAAPAPTKRKSTGKRSDKPNLIITLLPTILASLIATYARDRIPEEYQPCAPSPEEVHAIIGPLLDIIGRRVEVAAEVSQDVLDITNSIICGFAYGARAYVTYVDIKKYQERTAYEKQQPRRHQAETESNSSEQSGDFAGGLRAYQSQNVGAYPIDDRGNGSRPYESINGPNGNVTTSDDDGTELRDKEASLVADMFKRDRQGRVQLGLLPKPV